MNKPLVSVVFISYNRVELLKRTFEEFRRHCDYPNLELILSDDASSPRQRAAMLRMGFDNFIFSSRNEKMGANINKGIQAARGEYILHLEDDWECRAENADFIAQAVEIMKIYPDVGCVRFNFIDFPNYEIREGPTGRKVRVYFNSQPASKQSIYVYSNNPHLKRRSFHEDVGWFIEGEPVGITEDAFCRLFLRQNKWRVAAVEEWQLFRHIGAQLSTRPDRWRERLRYRLNKNSVARTLFSVYDKLPEGARDAISLRKIKRCFKYSHCEEPKATKQSLKGLLRADFVGARNDKLRPPRLVSMVRVKDEKWIIERWLERASEFSDAIVALDNGSTDGTYEVLKSHPRVASVIREEPGSPFIENEARNHLLKEAGRLGAEWIMILDADEIMDRRFASMKDALLNRRDVAWYHFQEITLWRSIREYRTDKPDLYMRRAATCRLARFTPHLRWGLPARYRFTGKVKGLLAGEGWKRMPMVIEAQLYGAKGDIVHIPDLVCLHYHFVDRERAWRVHMQYAVTVAILHRPSLNKIPQILDWSTSRLDEKGLVLAQVKPEWGVL